MKTLTKNDDSINETQCPHFPCWPIWSAFSLSAICPAERVH